MQNDFRARLDWCVTKKVADANHAPKVHCQENMTRNVLRIEAEVDRPLTLDAQGTTDPDGDLLTYRWFVYPEPGSYRGKATLRDDSTSKATLTVPVSARGKSLHVILQVTDNGTPPLTRYRRVIVEYR